ncbi:MAG: flagellar biosynthesis protein FlgN [Treponema sp.]|jgi:hypothetical protein|nr:flagellar biosynthesis protein FlgN [Treponema sp.]
MVAARERLVQPDDEVQTPQRVAVLKRFWELVYAQQERFRLYLVVLDKQRDAIERGSIENIIAYIEIEEKIMAEIVSIRKVIGPLEASYVESPEEDRIQASVLEVLKGEVVIRSKQNRELLGKRMAGLRSEIQALRKNPYTGRLSVYADPGVSSFLDMQG